MTGAECLAAGAWHQARRLFESALAERETADALEGLALAAWWLDDADVVFASRERAYKMYLDANDRRSAARLAVWLAWDCFAFRGETAVANGWLQRARRLLDGLPPSPELAWLESRESQLALAEDGDPDRAHRHATEAIRAGRAAGSIDYEMLGRSLQGLALVASAPSRKGCACSTRSTRRSWLVS
jgi:tetratricopeptide (TPR) repeat protein